ncbi:MAG: DUF4105 domain-containing protein [Candidatus Gracilibacteria bacterium]|nr:DUF4105 domain-containing protein [Candidatus Gracilibacteria bacterium]
MNKLKEITLKVLKCIYKILKTITKIIILIIDKLYIPIFMIFITIGFAWWSSQTPSLYRDWQASEAILPEITFNSGSINIKNVRNFSYISDTQYTPNYYDETYDIDKLETLYYIIEPFSDYDGPAHTMLSFGFSDGKYATISAEIRKEIGETFDPFRGIMNQYEIVYIVGDENDLIKLRANYRKDTVRMYPVNTPKEKIQQLFQTALHRADKLTKEPEFYNTLWNTCTTSILKHVNSLREEKITGFDTKILLPSNSDKIAYDLGLIDTKLSLEEAREYYKINELSEKYGNDNENYSKMIRKERK